MNNLFDTRKNLHDEVVRLAAVCRMPMSQWHGETILHTFKTYKITRADQIVAMDETMADPQSSSLFSIGTSKTRVTVSGRSYFN